jgi:NAD(P)-dependent dehydrogenase (short-subunit alcohol dehydrogenase family)
VPSATSPFRLDGKLALVTGAGRGIGRAVAAALAAAGAEIVLNSRTPAELEAVAAGIAARGGRARLLPFDVTDSARAREAIAGLAGLDILVNNAGVNRPQPFLEVDEATLDRMIALNLKAAFVVAQAAARHMVEKGAGVVINVTSQMGHVGSERDRTVRVVSIAPTFIETPLTKPFFDDPETRKWILDRIPLGRAGTLAEVANAVVFLASPAAGLVTGSSLLADGGWTAW